MARKDPARRRPRRAAHSPTRIPRAQWDLPVGFAADGREITLREVQKTHAPLPKFGDLSPAQQMELTVRRIERDPEFDTAMIGVGVIDPTRAVAEVRERSEVGRALIDVEGRLIDRLVAEVSRR